MAQARAAGRRRLRVLLWGLFAIVLMTIAVYGYAQDEKCMNVNTLQTYQCEQG